MSAHRNEGTGFRAETLIQDLKFGARLLRKNPGFAIVAVLTLALGIGPTTAVFSAVDTILLSPLPYVHPEQLVLLSETVPKLGSAEDLGVAAGEYLDYRDRNRSFVQVAAYQNDGFNLTGAGTPLRINADAATPSLFPLLGVQPAFGRTFSEEESRLGADRVVVLSHDLWHRQYGGDPGVLNRTIKLDEKPYTVIGVMPPSFRFPSDSAPASERVQLWVPLTFSQDLITDRLREFGVHVIGRRKPVVTAAQAEQDAQIVANGFMEEHADVYSGTLRVVPHTFPYSSYSVAKIRPLVILLIAAVTCVLLIACANVANLLLARATHRGGEMAIRAAIGARRSRLVRQCMLESGLLSLLGGLSGVLLALGLVAALRHFGPGNLGRLQDVKLHPIALAFTIALSLATSVIFGFFPALRLSQTSPQSCMKESVQAGSSRRAHNLQSRLVVSEIAVALMLLISSSLLVKSFVRVLNIPFGFNPEGAVVVRTLFDRPRYPDPIKREAVQKELIDRLSRIPGVSSVAAASHLPLSDARQIGFRLENAAANDFHWAENSLVSPGYFRVMGISVLRGREFTYDDRRDTPPAALVNEAFVKKFLYGKDPIGQRFHWGDRALFTIVGVVNDVHISALEADPPPMIYDSMFQVESGASSRTAFVLRMSRPTQEAEQGIYNAVPQQIWAVDKDLPAYETTTMAELVSESLAQRRFTTLLMSSFAGLAMILAAIGLFGVISYVVSERRRELAVRIALGADRRTICWMILQQGSGMALAGCAIGLLGFAVGSRLIRADLYQVSAFDPLTLFAAPLALVGVALLACYWPARRAMQSDPMVALRYE
jgi:putative ABC transport system permease protein